jgi:ribosomal-protein-alanine N-acetyltransferase
MSRNADTLERVIRPLVPRDAEELTRLLVANRAFLAPYEPERPESFYTVRGQRDRIKHADHLFAILDGRQIAGTIAVSNVVHGAFRSGNVGYWVDAMRNGRGLASGALAALVEHAFGDLGLHRLEAGTLVDNLGSQRVLEKNRFTRIGLAPRYLHIAGAWRDHLLFQRTVDD